MKYNYTGLLDQIWQAKRAGKTMEDIASVIGCDVRTVYLQKSLAKNGGTVSEKFIFKFAVGFKCQLSDLVKIKEEEEAE